VKSWEIALRNVRTSPKCFLLKTGDILNFWIFWFFHETTILQELSQKKWDISGYDWRILNPKPDLETSINSTLIFDRHQCDIRTKFVSWKQPQSRVGEKKIRIASFKNTNIRKPLCAKIFFRHYMKAFI
jgi:hypothetical protein